MGLIVNPLLGLVPTSVKNPCLAPWTRNLGRQDKNDKQFPLFLSCTEKLAYHAEQDKTKELGIS